MIERTTNIKLVVYHDDMFSTIRSCSIGVRVGSSLCVVLYILFVCVVDDSLISRHACVLLNDVVVIGESVFV